MYKLQVLSWLLQPSLRCPWIYKQSLRETAMRKGQKGALHWIPNTQHIHWLCIKFCRAQFPKVSWQAAYGSTGTVHLGVFGSAQHQAESTPCLPKTEAGSFAQPLPAHPLAAGWCTKVLAPLTFPGRVTWSHPVWQLLGRALIISSGLKGQLGKSA